MGSRLAIAASQRIRGQTEHAISALSLTTAQKMERIVLSKGPRVVCINQRLQIRRIPANTRVGMSSSALHSSLAQCPLPFAFGTFPKWEHSLTAETCLRKAQCLNYDEALW